MIVFTIPNPNPNPNTNPNHNPVLEVVLHAIWYDNAKHTICDLGTVKQLSLGVADFVFELLPEAIGYPLHLGPTV